MKNLTYILIALLFATSCKKAKITKKMNGSSWELQQILLEDEDVTATIKETKIVYLQLDYAKTGKEITFANPTQTFAIEQEVGTWKLEKIVPTVGKRYFMIRNEIAYNFERRKVFNLTEYGNNLQMTDDNTLTQTITYTEGGGKGDSPRENSYTIIYKKI